MSSNNRPLDVPAVGLTDISKPRLNGDTVADVVFVHGLGGHPERTWTYQQVSQGKRDTNAPSSRRKVLKTPFRWLQPSSKGQPSTPPQEQDQSSPECCFWPADLMARDFTDVRVLTYGYESQVARFFQTLNLSTITQHSQDLLSRLTSERRECPERPLIFIAHSLGGLLVKGALNESAQYNPGDAQRRISTECRMVMFFGTPHRGSDFTQWGSAVANIAGVLGFTSNKKILDNLGRESEILQRLERDFESVISQNEPSGRKFIIYTFQEAKGVGGPFNKQVVPDSSSHYNRRDLEISFRINENHMDICRFKGEGDENYKVLKKELWQYLKPIRESQKAPKSLLDSNVVRQGIGAIRQSSDPIEQYLQALGLSKSALTAYQAEPPQEVTTPAADLSWFLEHPDFETWDREESNGILWLGNKSMKESGHISSYIWRQRLDRAVDGRSEVTIYYPLPSSRDGSATDQGKPDSVVHVARTLIGQLLYQNFARVHYMIQQYPYEKLHRDISIKYTGAEQPILAAKVSFRVLLYALTAISHVHVNVIISGIDELGTEKYRLIECLWTLYSFLKAPDAPLDIVVKTLFTSRPIDTSQALTGPWNFLSKIPYIEKDKEANDCLQSLRVANFDYSKRFDSVFGAGDKAGSWLWMNDDYMAWRYAETSSLLLIEGKPGSGKSTLVKRILETIPSQGQQDADESDIPLVAYFFYSYRGGALETSHQIMLQSILYQLLRQDRTRLYPLFRKVYRRRLRDGIQEWKIEDLIQIMSSLQDLNLGNRIFIFLDGMDESDANKDGVNWRSNIFDMMLKICSNNSCTIKALIATRPLRENDMGTKKYGTQDSQFRLVLQELNSWDIEALVTEDLEEITHKAGFEDGLPQLRIDSLKTYIVENAAGVFAWVSLVLNEVKLQHKERGLSLDELEQLQEMLPPELGDFYKQIVKRLNENTPKQEQKRAIAEARKLLICVSFAQRSLTLVELRDAFAVPSVLEVGAEYNIDILKRKRNMAFERRIRYTCGDLLSVTGSYVQLFHETVRDFLLDKEGNAEPFGIERGMGNITMSSICMRYLMISLSQPALEARGLTTPTSVNAWAKNQYEELVELLDDRPFLAYAVKAVETHKAEAETEEGREFSSDYSAALADLNAEYLEFQHAMQITECSRCISGEHLMSGLKPDNFASFYSKAMIAAATGGQTTALRILIELGANMNSVDEENNVSPLFAACLNRQTGAVKVLLESGADCDASDEYGETALHKAVLNGEDEIVRLLLQHGAWTEAENLDSERPLHLAAVNGHVSIVNQLLDTGCDVDCADNSGGTPLHKAAANGHVEVARVLLGHEVAVNEGGAYRGTPLHRAVDQGHEEMVELLLQHGADVNDQSSYGGTPLHSAAASGREGIVALLLKKDANIELKDHYGYTPLMWASMNHHDNIISLLQQGVDRNEDDSLPLSKAGTERLFGLAT